MWESHYTGIDVKETKHVYVQRDATTRRINFIRIHKKKAHAGAFIGRLNYALKVHYKAKGVELFFSIPRVPDFGFALFLPFAKPCVRWSGSPIAQYSVCVLGAGPFMFFFQTPEWLKRKKHDADIARWEAEYNHWEE